MSDSKPTTLGDFEGSRMLIVRTIEHDPALQHRNTEIRVGQGHTTPTLIAVGHQCSDAYIHKVWSERQRCPNIKLEDLRAVRDGILNSVPVHSHAG